MEIIIGTTAAFLERDTAARPAAAATLPKPTRAPKKKFFVWFLGKR
jgi:hypothetical protein